MATILGRLKSALDVLSSIAVVIAAGALLWSLWGRPTAPTAQGPISDVTDLSMNLAQARNVRGSGSVAVVEFSDYQCPFCRKFAIETWPSLQAQLVDKGRVRYVAMQFPLTEIHPLAFQASEAAECARRQGRYWEMHDRLFSSKALMRRDLTEHAKALDLAIDEFDACVDGGRARSDIEADQAEGKRLSVNGTPAFFLGTVHSGGTLRLVRRIRGAVSFAELSKEIDKLVSSRSATLVK